MASVLLLAAVHALLCWARPQAALSLHDYADVGRDACRGSPARGSSGDCAAACSVDPECRAYEVANGDCLTYGPTLATPLPAPPSALPRTANTTCWTKQRHERERRLQGGSFTTLEVYSKRDCAGSPVRTEILSGIHSTHCSQCWDRCDQGFQGQVANKLSYRLFGPGTAVLAWNCIGPFLYPSAGFSTGGSFDEASGCYSPSGGGTVVLCSGNVALDYFVEFSGACSAAAGQLRYPFVAAEVPKVHQGRFAALPGRQEVFSTHTTIEQFSNGSFVGTGHTPGGDLFEYFGGVVHSNCNVEAGGLITTMLQTWFREPGTDAGMECIYVTWEDAVPTPRQIAKKVFVGFSFSAHEFQDGLLPGYCPNTLSEAEAGIIWMPSSQLYSKVMLCEGQGQCGSFECFDPAREWWEIEPFPFPSADVPVIELGIFQGVSSDPTYNSLLQVQFANGTFTGQGNRGPNQYNWIGGVVHSHCVDNGDGTLQTMVQTWFRDDLDIGMSCIYSSWTAGMPATRVSRTSIQSTWFNHDDVYFKAGILPGTCPDTLAEAEGQMPIVQTWLPAAAESISWDMTCIGSCGPAACARTPHWEIDAGYGFVPADVPAVELGTFKGDSDLASVHSMDQVQYANGTYAGLGDWDGMEWHYVGGVVDSFCAVQDDGTIETMMQTWFQDDWTYGMGCVYNTWAQGASEAILVSRTGIEGTGGAFTLAAFQAGLVPGSCPTTFVATETLSSIRAWMPDAAYSDQRNFTCVKNCGPFACKRTPFYEAIAASPLATVAVPLVEYGLSSGVVHGGNTIEQAMFENGSFVGSIYQDGFNLPFFGAVTYAQCASSEGVMETTQQIWFKEDWSYGVGCTYATWSGGSGVAGVISQATRMSETRYVVTGLTEEQLLNNAQKGQCPDPSSASLDKIAGFWPSVRIRNPMDVDFACLENCGPFVCERAPFWEVVGGSGFGQYAVPEVEVGTFRGVSSDPASLWFEQTQFSNGTFTARRDRNGWEFVHVGVVVLASETTEPDGTLSTMVQSWMQDDTVNPKMACVYNSWGPGSPATHLWRKEFRGSGFSASNFTGGTLPGTCPDTYAQAAQGIGWMTGLSVGESFTLTCVADCGNYTSTTTTTTTATITTATTTWTWSSTSTTVTSTATATSTAGTSATGTATSTASTSASGTATEATSTTSTSTTSTATNSTASATTTATGTTTILTLTVAKCACDCFLVTSSKPLVRGVALANSAGFNISARRVLFRLGESYGGLSEPDLEAACVTVAPCHIFKNSQEDTQVLLNASCQLDDKVLPLKPSRRLLGKEL